MIISQVIIQLLIPHITCPKCIIDNIIFRNTSSGEIESITKKLPSKGSYGYDEISTKILQISATFISSPLCNIINKSLSSGKFLDRLKYSIVIPVYKKGEKYNLYIYIYPY
jgi:hypothetical protein